MLTDKERQTLTEMLGEEWHEIQLNAVCSCGEGGWFSKKKETEHLQKNRTFDTWQDFGDVLQKLNSKEASEVERAATCCGTLSLLIQMKQPDFIEKFMKAVCEMKGGGE